MSIRDDLEPRRPNNILICKRRKLIIQIKSSCTALWLCVFVSFARHVVFSITIKLEAITLFGISLKVLRKQCVQFEWKSINGFQKLSRQQFRRTTGRWHSLVRYNNNIIIPSASGGGLPWQLLRRRAHS